MYKLLFEKFLQQFIKTFGRKPQTRKELMSIQDDVVRYLNKTKGVPEKKPTSPFQGFTPKVIQGGKSKEGITSIPVNKQIQDLKTFEREVIDELNAPIKPDLKVVKDKTLLKDSPERIAKIKAENKAAIKRLKDKKKTVEDFRDDGDWDPSGMASGGIAGQLHLNQGGRAGFANGSPLVDARMHNTYEENKAANEAQRQTNFEYLQNKRQGSNLNQLGGLKLEDRGGYTLNPGGGEANEAIIYSGLLGGRNPDQIKAQAVYDTFGPATGNLMLPSDAGMLGPESQITNEAQANELAELMAPGSTQSYRKPTFEQRMGGESWDMLSDGDQYRIAQEYPGQTPPRRNLGFIPSNFAKGGRVSLSNGGLANILGV